MTFGTALKEHTMAASANIFYIAIGYKNEANMKVTAINISVKIRHMFSEQRILGVCMTTVQRKISVDLTRTCFWIRYRLYLWK